MDLTFETNKPSKIEDIGSAAIGVGFTTKHLKMSHEQKEPFLQVARDFVGDHFLVASRDGRYGLICPPVRPKCWALGPSRLLQELSRRFGGLTLGGSQRLVENEAIEQYVRRALGATRKPTGREVVVPGYLLEDVCDWNATLGTDGIPLRFALLGGKPEVFGMYFEGCPDAVRVPPLLRYLLCINEQDQGFLREITPGHDRIDYDKVRRTDGTLFEGQTLDLEQMAEADAV